MVTMVKYMNRMVVKEGFRAFVYHRGWPRKLVESWDDYQKHLKEGWVDSQEMLAEPVIEIKESSMTVIEEPDNTVMSEDVEFNKKKFKKDK